MNNLIELQNLSKSFGDFTLENISLNLPGGCILGLVGENGAGKTTLLRLILQILKQDSGTVRIFGTEAEEKVMPLRKAEIGVVTDEIGLPDVLSPAMLGKVMAGVYKNWDAEQFRALCEKFALPMQKPFKALSKGMKMKLGIAIALSHNSRLLLLDEATAGLDPVIREEILDVFRDFVCDEEHAVILSSHIVSDLEKICDYIAFLHQGRLLLCEEKDVLLSAYLLVHCDAAALENIEKDKILWKRVTPYGAKAVVYRNAVPQNLQGSPLTLEELFVSMVKGEKNA